MTDLKSLNYFSDHGSVTKSENGRVTFEVNMPPFTKEYSFVGEGCFDSKGYFVIEYSTMGWRRPSIYRHPCIAAINESGEEIPLVCYDDLTADGRKYTVLLCRRRRVYCRCGQKR